MIDHEPTHTEIRPSGTHSVSGPVRLAGHWTWGTVEREREALVLHPPGEPSFERRTGRRIRLSLHLPVECAADVVERTEDVSVLAAVPLALGHEPVMLGRARIADVGPFRPGQASVPLEAEILIDSLRDAGPRARRAVERQTLAREAVSV